VCVAACALAWINGKRQPNLDTMLRLTHVYEVDARDLTGDELEFAVELADPDRIKAAETNIESVRDGKPLPPGTLRARKHLRPVPEV